MRIKGPCLGIASRAFRQYGVHEAAAPLIRKEGERPRYKYDCRKTPVYDINDIRRMLPHRPPFLLVDRIFHVDDNSIAGIKNVTMNEPFFVGAFPQRTGDASVLITSRRWRSAAESWCCATSHPENYSTYFMKIDGVKFKRRSSPGDTLNSNCISPNRSGAGSA